MAESDYSSSPRSDLSRQGRTLDGASLRIDPDDHDDSYLNASYANTLQKEHDDSYSRDLLIVAREQVDSSS